MTDLTATTTDLSHSNSTGTPPQRRGVVNCALYQDGRRVKDIAVEECGGFTGPAGAVVWLGLYEPDPVTELAVQGATIMINISGSPYTIDKRALRLDMLRSGIRIASDSSNMSATMTGSRRPSAIARSHSR